MNHDDWERSLTSNDWRYTFKSELNKRSARH